MSRRVGSGIRKFPNPPMGMRGRGWKSAFGAITILHPNLHWNITFSACDALLLIRIPYQGIWSHRSITSGEREYKPTFNNIRRLYHCIKRIFSFSPRQAPKIWTVFKKIWIRFHQFLKAKWSPKHENFPEVVDNNGRTRPYPLICSRTPPKAANFFYPQMKSNQ